VGILDKVSNLFKRRKYLREKDKDIAAELAQTKLGEIAPELVDAVRELQKVVTGAAYDAVEAAHDNLQPVFSEAVAEVVTGAGEHYDKHEARLDTLAEWLTERIDLCEKHIAEQAEQLTTFREAHSEQQLELRRYKEGYDWKILKDFSLRFVRILDNLRSTIEALPDDCDADHRNRLGDVYTEILFALEAGGVEQFMPEAGTEFAGQEKQLKVVGKAATEQEGQHGCVASVRRPGYLLTQDGEPDRILRPAEVEIFEVLQLQGEAS